MSHVDALKIAEHLRERLVDLAVSENYVRDNAFARACRELWGREAARDAELISELWVEGTFPGEKTHDTLDLLVEEGLFPADLRDHIARSGVFPSSRRLFNHQSDTLRTAAEPGKTDGRPTLVVTAGTGLGKTEAFLFPVLADLWTAPKRSCNGGMRTLILYPMNALVADQVERLYRWLQGQSRLSLFHFTGETPEDKREADRMGEPEWTACRMRTRQEARGLETHRGECIDSTNRNPVPDIIITNYCMLEYMLCRPQDACFFGSDLRSIVLDEAHLYTGTLAAEIALLLRRVAQRCGVPLMAILKVATSATLGGDDHDLLAFAADIFSVPQESIRVIRGRHMDLPLAEQESPPSRRPSAADLVELSDPEPVTLTADNELKTDAHETVLGLTPTVSLLVADDLVREAATAYPGTPAQFLHATLSRAPLIREIAGILNAERGRVISLTQLAAKLFPEDDLAQARPAVTRLLRLAAGARLDSNELPIIPHRIHLLARAPEGVSVCLNPECVGTARVAQLGALQAHADRCRYCAHILLPVHRCDNCGEWALAAHENQDTSCLEPGYLADRPSMRTFYLLARPLTAPTEESWVNPSTGRVQGYGAQGTELWKAPCRDSDGRRYQYCPVCGSDWTIGAEDMDAVDRKDVCKPLREGRYYALSVIAETILHHLPPLEGVSRAWKPAEGRRLLCFSDSRASAASLGPRLTLQHEIQVVRSAIGRAVDEILDSSAIRLYLQEERERRTEMLRHAKEPGLRRKLEAEQRQKEVELSQITVGTPFVDFARSVASRPEIEQILDRDSADGHTAARYGQNDWERNARNAREHVEALIARELDHPIKKQVSVEAVGLIEVTYPGCDRLSLPCSFEERLKPGTRAQLQGVWPETVGLLLDTVRLDRCVGWSQESDQRRWLGASPLEGRWLTRTIGGWRARAFVGRTPNQSRRRFAARLLSALGYSETDAIDLSEYMLCAIFDQLYELAGTSLGWLGRKETHEVAHDRGDRAIQILFDKLSLRRPQHLFLCPTTHTVWTRCTFGWVPAGGCQGCVQEVTSTQLDNDARWGRPRREMLTSAIFTQGLWAEEHSAQLDSRENRRLQDLFKRGIRNILSSTTTMELGIDIGGLNAVLLANVPPGPANHRQRAGRAGRRADGSAIVVTFARDSEFDRQVFEKFEAFLQRPLRRPVVFMHRERVIRRHLYAVLFSHFMRPAQPKAAGATQAFGVMGSFCGETVPGRWTAATGKPAWPAARDCRADDFIEFLSNIRSNPTGIAELISGLARGTPLEDLSDTARWCDFTSSASKLYEEALGDWRDEMEGLRQAWDAIPCEGASARDMAQANAIRYQAQMLSDIRVIEWFASKRFLPRYGFPINLQKLTVRQPVEDETNRRRARSRGSAPDERFRLERSSLLALSEYVPGSHVLVGGRVAVSRGILKHWTEANMDRALGLQYIALECENGHVYISQERNALCPACQELPTGQPKLLLFPRYGYTTAAWESLDRNVNLERVARGVVYPIGFTAKRSDDVTVDDFGGFPGLRGIFREEAELLIHNEGASGCGFAVCTRCGYADSESNRYARGRMNLPEGFEKHASIFATDAKESCWRRSSTDAPVLRNRFLAARENTDMIRLVWPGLGSDESDVLYTLGRAMVKAGVHLLELDDRELEIADSHSVNDGVTIYDTAPGGAGHCLELFSNPVSWLEEARRVLWVDEEHNWRCERACLDCLLDFSSQYYAHRLRRRAAVRRLGQPH